MTDDDCVGERAPFGIDYRLTVYNLVIRVVVSLKRFKPRRIRVAGTKFIHELQYVLTICMRLFRELINVTNILQYNINNSIFNTRHDVISTQHTSILLIDFLLIIIYFVTGKPFHQYIFTLTIVSYKIK